MAIEVLSDPAITTRLVVGAYGVSAAIAFWRAKVAKKMSARPLESKYLAIAVLFLFLALSYQLDLIPRGIGIAKGIAKQQGWYVYRWPIAGFLLLTGAIVVAVLLRSWRPMFRQHNAAQWLTIAGTLLLTGYFVLRATSLHWVDPWLGFHLGCPKTNPWIEIAGAAIIAAGLSRSPISGVPSESASMKRSSTLLSL